MTNEFTKAFSRAGLVALVAGALVQPVAAQSLVKDDLITGSKETTPWLVCDEDTVTDVATLDAGGCAFRTTPAAAGVTYRMSCGVSVAKYASITLAFLDAEDNTLDKKVTEVFEHTSGGYSVTLEAPAGTTTAAIGIYGEPGSGFQDCVLIDATPAPEPTKGSISGVTWFDDNGDSIFDSGESTIAGTTVILEDGPLVFGQTQTDSDGKYYFGHLDIDACYTVSFIPADSTLQAGFAGGDNDSLDGLTDFLCLTEETPDITDIDAAFVAVPPVVPPADYAICGYAWADLNSNGGFNGDDTTLPYVAATLFDADGNQIDSTTTNESGNYAFFKLTAGDYRVLFESPDGYEPTSATAGQPTGGASFINKNATTRLFSIPDESNTAADSACTIQNVNAGFVQLPVALDPTIALNDSVSFDVGVDFSVDFLANDIPCNGAVLEVDLLGHNVPGNVVYDASSQQFLVSGTTDFGTYSIEYGIRGSCGSYDTASIIVDLKEVIPPAPPTAPDAPLCRVETGGSTRIGGVDVFHPEEFGFASNYNLYDRDRKLVITTDSTDYTHKRFIGQDETRAGERPYKGNWEIEWNGTNYGYDQVSIYFMSAVENGEESELFECIRTLISPIAIDLHNKGRIQRLQGDFLLDLDEDGVREPLGQWFAPTAGILVTADASGQISGKHLFGNVPGIYADGFEELATLDNNSDGQLTGDELLELAIWTDLDSDTLVDEGELSSIADNQIVALSVEHYKYMSRATKANGRSVLMEDVWLPLAPLAVR